MGAPPDNVRDSKAQGAAELLSYLGVAPLVLGLLGVGLLPELAERELAQRLAIGWGAVLLAGCGGVHWGLALAGRMPWAAARIGAAVLPALCGAAAVVLGGQRGLAVLAAGLGGLWLYEHRVLGAALPPAWLSLRRNLTLATCMLLALTMFASETAGLS
jgi:Protein of unknown function (DUF3429)